MNAIKKQTLNSLALVWLSNIDLNSEKVIYCCCSCIA